jgi:hypothetical protein
VDIAQSQQLPMVLLPWLEGEGDKEQDILVVEVGFSMVLKVDQLGNLALSLQQTIIHMVEVVVRVLVDQEVFLLTMLDLSAEVLEALYKVEMPMEAQGLVVVEVVVTMAVEVEAVMQTRLLIREWAQEEVGPVLCSPLWLAIWKDKQEPMDLELLVEHHQATGFHPMVRQEMLVSSSLFRFLLRRPHLHNFE